MGEIADSMINGELCAICGAYLEVGETIVPQNSDDIDTMPEDGTPFGVPVLCLECWLDEN